MIWTESQRMYAGLICTLLFGVVFYDLWTRLAANLKKKADEEKKKKEEEKRLAEEKKMAEEKRLTEEKKMTEEKKITVESIPWWHWALFVIVGVILSIFIYRGGKEDEEGPAGGNPAASAGGNP